MLLMSAQNTHYIPVFDRVFGLFHLVISAFIVVYLILTFFCISDQKYDIWNLCGDLKKKIGAPLNLNVATFSLYDVQPTSSNVATLRSRQDSPSEIFSNITRRTRKEKKKRKEERCMRRRRRPRKIQEIV